MLEVNPCKGKAKRIAEAATRAELQRQARLQPKAKAAVPVFKPQKDAEARLQARLGLQGPEQPDDGGCHAVRAAVAIHNPALPPAVPAEVPGMQYDAAAPVVVKASKRAARRQQHAEMAAQPAAAADAGALAPLRGLPAANGDVLDWYTQALANGGRSDCIEPVPFKNNSNNNNGHAQINGGMADQRVPVGSPPTAFRNHRNVSPTPSATCTEWAEEKEEEELTVAQQVAAQFALQQQEEAALQPVLERGGEDDADDWQHIEGHDPVADLDVGNWNRWTPRQQEMWLQLQEQEFARESGSQANGVVAPADGSQQMQQETVVYAAFETVQATMFQPSTTMFNAASMSLPVVSPAVVLPCFKSLRLDTSVDVGWKGVGVVDVGGGGGGGGVAEEEEAVDEDVEDFEDLMALLC
ncbi:MAG: hypothetical protein WDW38_003795 [Sanguina aurantia]